MTMLTHIYKVIRNIMSSISIQMMNKYTVISTAYIAYFRFIIHEFFVMSHKMYFLTFPEWIILPFHPASFKNMSTFSGACFSHTYEYFKAYWARFGSVIIWPPIRISSANRMMMPWSSNICSRLPLARTNTRTKMAPTTFDSRRHGIKYSSAFLTRDNDFPTSFQIAITHNYYCNTDGILLAI